MSTVNRTLVALLASALSPLPLLTLFSDRGWLLDVWLSMIIVVAPAALLRLRRPAGGLQILPGLVLAALWLTARFLGDTAWHGVLPTTDTWHQVSVVLHSVQQSANDDVAPVQSTVAIQLTLCAVLALLAALIDVLAVAARFGALAGVPLLVVYSAAGAVPHRPVPWLLFLAPAVGFLLLLALDAGEDRQRWGHRVARPARADGPRGLAGPMLGRSGQRIAALALLAAVVLPLATPSGGTNLVSLVLPHHGGGSAGRIDPFAALKGQLSQHNPEPLAQVQVYSATPVSPLFLREIVLPVFTGKGWKQADTSSPTQALATTAFPAWLPGQTQSSQQFAVRISNVGLEANPPVFAQPLAVRGLDGGTRWSTEDQLLVGTTMRKGETFVETVSQPMPSAAELARATGLPTDPVLRDRLAPLLALPKIPKQVHDLVAALIRGKTTPYARAKAINDFFLDPSSGFSYSLQTVTGDSNSDLVDFLTNRVGYCQQYAAAMAVMLRMAGVPARVVLGYAHAKPDAGGTFTVSSADAHAWVEAYFTGVGWVPFDPTPASGLPAGHTSALPYAQFRPVAGDETTPKTSSAPAQPTNKPHATDAQNAGTDAATATAHDRGLPGWLVPLLIACALVALGLAPALVRAHRRRKRLRAARSGDPDPLWAELADTAVDLGYVWSPTRTPRQVVQGLSGAAGAAAGSLATLARAVERHRYAPSEADGAGAPRAGGGRAIRRLERQLAEVRAGLRSGCDRSTRVRALLWPQSLRGRRARREH